MQRPEVCTDAMLRFLDSLRESGAINMFGARPYVESTFGLSKKETSEVLSYWMKSFGREDR